MSCPFGYDWVKLSVWVNTCLLSLVVFILIIFLWPDCQNINIGSSLCSIDRCWDHKGGEGGSALVLYPFHLKYFGSYQTTGHRGSEGQGQKKNEFKRSRCAENHDAFMVKQSQTLFIAWFKYLNNYSPFKMQHTRRANKYYISPTEQHPREHSFSFPQLKGIGVFHIARQPMGYFPCSFHRPAHQYLATNRVVRHHKHLRMDPSLKTLWTKAWSPLLWCHDDQR